MIACPPLHRRLRLVLYPSIRFANKRTNILQSEIFETTRQQVYNRRFLRTSRLPFCSRESKSGHEEDILASLCCSHSTTRKSFWLEGATPRQLPRDFFSQEVSRRLMAHRTCGVTYYASLPFLFVWIVFQCRAGVPRYMVFCSGRAYMESDSRCIRCLRMWARNAERIG